jgi:hypothetical protein
MLNFNLVINRKDMKKYIVCSLLLLCSISQFNCKNYLDVKPLDKLTGNNYYKTREDVDAVINDLSRRFFNKINETHFIGAVGEYRSGEVLHEPESDYGPARRFVEVLGKNDLNQLLSANQDWGFYAFDRITDWKGYYQIIQSANILIYNLDLGVEALTDNQTKAYIAEAKFARCLAYFIMVRLYGDVPYYTNAFNVNALPRENMVSVMNKCIADLQPNLNDLPWTYPDPAQKGVKASRGSAIALLMNMNMWNAGFDVANAAKYWRETADLGDALIKSNAYKLLPLNKWASVIKGRSEESLFELYRSINYNDEVSGITPFGDMFLAYPYKLPQNRHQVSFAYFKAEYMEKIYPENVADKRKDAWFLNMYANNGEFQVLKYAQNAYAEGEEEDNPDQTFLIFRYAESILLRAEALSNLGDEAEAKAMVNMTRIRADAPVYQGSGGQDLKDFIFLERSRELLGEGHHFFDLIRTKRILSRVWTYNVLNLDQFNRGAWTWPINSSALNNNPLMVLNTYWTNGGR